jgi:phosphoribosyl 1,2-cyclic phosphodiesterase
MHISLTCLGTGDGVPIAGRNHSAYLYTFGDTTLLVDCGEPISSSYKASGLDYNLIDAIFISHLHSDHFSGFFMLIQSFWLEHRQKPLTVYLPTDAIAPIRQMLNTAFLFAEMLPFSMTFVPLKPLGSIAVGPVKVTPCPTSHLERTRKSLQAKYPGEYIAYSFLFEAVHLRLVHSADIGAPEDLDLLLSQQTDFLLCEMAHATPETILGYLAGKPISRILLTHVARHEWERLPELQQTAYRILAGKNYSFARDGDKITISAS